MFEKSSTKNVRYTIEDNFFTFWFRFIYKYNYILEIENYESVKAIISRDYETFSGLMLERYFKRVLMKSKLTLASVVGGTGKGENEIDIVVENELSNEATFFEVKRKAKTSISQHWKQKPLHSYALQESSRAMLFLIGDCQWMTCSRFFIEKGETFG